MSLALLASALLPALSAVWLVPGFVTQDGPAHLYNAHLLLDSISDPSPADEVFEVHWRPLPNWAGHLGLVGLMAAGASPWVADRIVMSVTLAGLAGAIVWLRWRVRGAQGLPVATLLATVLAMNVTWLLGFSSFLLGACLFPVILGLWWTARDRPGPAPAAALAMLLVLAYFAHVVALGLTVVGLLVLTLATPCHGSVRHRRWAWTLASLAPLVPLGVLYRSIMSGGGPIAPLWMELEDPTALASWRARLVWVDPLTLGSKIAAPFVDRKSLAFAPLTPVLWIALGLAALAAATALRARRRAVGPSPQSPEVEGPGAASRRDSRGWIALAGLLILGGVFGPDTLGERHGNYLAQRVLLIGLIALVPWLDLAADRFLTRFGAAAIGFAVLIQGAFVWDYALRSDRAVTTFLRAAPYVKPGDRIGTLLLDLRPAFRANPLRHAGTLLGIDTGGVVWSNYEAAHYYFPVQVRTGMDHPPVLAFEDISILDAPEVAAERADAWTNLLARYHGSIDLLIVWGDDPRGLDPITARWYEPVHQVGPLRILRRRGPAPTGPHQVASFGPPWSDPPR